MGVGAGGGGGGGGGRVAVSETVGVSVGVNVGVAVGLGSTTIGATSRTGEKVAAEGSLPPAPPANNQPPIEPPTTVASNAPPAAAFHPALVPAIRPADCPHSDFRIPVLAAAAPKVGQSCIAASATRCFSSKGSGSGTRERRTASAETSRRRCSWHVVHSAVWREMSLRTETDISRTRYSLIILSSSAQ